MCFAWQSRAVARVGRHARTNAKKALDGARRAVFGRYFPTFKKFPARKLFLDGCR